MLFVTVILVTTLCAYALLWFFVLWVGERVGRRWTMLDSGRAEALLRPNARAALHQTSSPFIEMPEHAKTRDQMVAWMTTELPKLMEENSRTGVHRH